MKVCESWLDSWTKTGLSQDEIIHKFTMAGLELAECDMAAPLFNNVVVAEVLETKAHPQADKLTVCQVDNGDEVVQIVCGASNVRQGLKVALAKPGAHLPGGIKIGEAKLRGESSFGMLCSAVELGCAEQSDGIWELPKDAPVGEDFRDFFNLNEKIYGFELTPNRGDCFSALGLARELAAISNSPIESFAPKKVQAMHEDLIPIDLKASDVCPRYCGRYIKGIKPHIQSPVWLREGLRRIGLRSLHPVVDVLNYTMFYLGQPMHAFDLHKIERQIVVRRAKFGETLELLNGKIVSLTEGTPVIADSKAPIAIAGVMGSLASCVDEDTIDIFLESAFFAPLALAGVARSFGLASDASIRYERGVDPNLAPLALEFATALLISIVGGTPGVIQTQEDVKYLPKIHEVRFEPSLLTRRTGVSISTKDMQAMLLRLNFVLETSNENEWKIQVPSYRFDIRDDVDIVEELLRLYGYDNIPSMPIDAPLKPGKMDATETSIQDFSQILKDLGYTEAINYAFVDPKLQEMVYPGEKAIQLLNPISPELSEMRLGLWPGLIANLVHNVNRQQQHIKLFEAGVIFKGTAVDAKETKHLAGILYGNPNGLNWGSQDKAYDFFDAKGELEHLLMANGIHDYQFIPSKHDVLHPGQSADVYVGHEIIATVGVLHPRWQQVLDVMNPVVLWSLNLSVMPEKAHTKYQRLSKFPHTRRDISFVMAKTVLADDIIKAIRAIIPHAILKDVQVFDVYAGKEIEPGHVSIALACIFQNFEKTMVEADIIGYQDKILQTLKQKFDIQLRDGQ